MKEYDIIVIGAGPGGYVAAIRAAQLGANVAIVEKDDIGGTCLNKGCIPTKALVASTDLLINIKNSKKFGIEIDHYDFDFKTMIKNKNIMVKKLINGINFLFKKYKVELLKGTGKILEPGIVEVKKENEVEKFFANNIIIATGSKPLVFPNFNYDGKMILTSDDALNLKKLPKSILIVGSGVVGCEFASIFSTLGCKVTMIDIAENILPTEGITISKNIAISLKKKGIKIMTKEIVKEIVAKESHITAYTNQDDEIIAEMALICIGRQLSDETLGLKDLDIKLDKKGGIVVNERMETNIKGIYAIGDITNKIQLAHVASAQGKVAAENIMGKDVAMNYNIVPRCIFTSPEVASVGMDLESAITAGYKALKGSFPYNKNGKAMAMGLNEGVVEIIVDQSTDKILGAQIVGEQASNLISEITLAMENKLTCKQLIKTIHPHPTLSETIVEAAELIYGIAIHN